MTHELDVVAAFRERLADVPEPRSRSRLVPAAAAAVVAAAIVALSLASSRPPDALAITRSAGWLELRIADATASPEEMTRELNDAEIPGRVIAVPVARDRVGTWVTIGEAARKTTCIPPSRGQGEPEVVRLGAIEYGRSVLRIPVARARETSGQGLYFVAGRAAKPGEPMVDPTSTADQSRIFESISGPHPDRLTPC